jgi:SAM-dependent methyltransferase
MSVFGNYARYYDLLYRDKDYAIEADYIHDLIQEYAPGSKTILDLGCGTGRHDTLLAQKGYTLHGVDMSEEMLAVAHTNLSASISNLIFTQGDIRTIRLNKQFDVVTSLFHVISYQTANEDLESAFATVKSHLKPGGLFIFDCWYGPAVLTDRPVKRVKSLEDDAISVVRTAEPVMHPNENIVDVNYSILIKDKGNGQVEEVKETHRMRYLFKPEIEILFAGHGLKLIGCEEFLSGREPGFDTWGVCFMGMCL